ncbi:MAG: hypothetical protein ACR2NZ_03715 [Rubripirellula sp.]
MSTWWSDSTSDTVLGGRQQSLPIGPADLRILSRQPILILLFLAIVGSSLCSVNADSPLTLNAPSVGGSSEAIAITDAQAKESIQWLASKAMKQLPPTIDGDKNWGDTKKVWAGVKLRRDGFKLKTNRRWRELEQGRWIKYEVTMPGKPPEVTIRNVFPKVDGETGDRRWLIQSSVVAPMKFTARIQRWNLGVKLFSMTITGEIQMRLASATSVGFYADYAQIPPGLIIDPKVEHAQLVMERFEVDRVSNIGGDVAEGWGEVMQELLVERLVSKQNDRIVEKLNRAIEKERDDLRISWSEWFQNWGSQMGAAAPVQPPAN